MEQNGLPEDIERLLTCPVCLDVFTQPVVILPCQHNLCRKCAEECYDRRGRVVGLSGGKFQCPTCRYEVMVDRHGVYSLPRNLLVENLIEMYATQIAKKQQAPPEPPKPEPIREPTPPPANRVPLCEDHEDERINVFCLSCQKPTCSMCKVFGKHQNCDVIPIKKAYDDQKSELREHMSRLGSGIEQIQTVQADTDHLRQNVEAASKLAKQEVNQAFQQLCALLEKRKTAMILTIQEDVNERIGILSDMSTSYKKQRDEIQKVMNDGLKLTEEQEATVFLTKSRTMINKVVNQARAMTEIRPPQSIVPELKPYKIDFSRYHQICNQIDFDNGQRQAQRPESARSRLPSNHSNTDLSCIPGLARPPPIPAPTDDEISNFRAMADALKQAEDGSGV